MPRNGSTSRDSDTLGTVARAAVILRSLAEAEDDVSIKSLSDQLQLAPSTVHRLLHLLMEQGLVERGENGHRYHAGTEFFRLGALVVNKTRIPKLALPYMRAVVDKCDEFCLLTMYLPAERKTMIAQSVSSSHPLTYALEKFRAMEIAWGARSRCILAHLPDADVREIYDEAEVSPATGRGLPPFDEFMSVLADIRRKGYAYSISQKLQGAVGIAAPLFGAQGSVFGSLNVTVPEFRWDEKRLPEIAGVLVEQARRLSGALGCRSAGGLYGSQHEKGRAMNP
jgi:DNA-binding IclR family transcriptional regulator